MAEFKSHEAAHFWRYISGSLRSLMSLVETEQHEVLRYRPPSPEANSIVGLARHTLANAAENILGVIGGESANRDRETEFQDMAPGTLIARWESLLPELEECLSTLPPGGLDSNVQHPRRGEIAAREVLIIVARHAAEHLGQAELTRDLARIVNRKS